MGPIPALFVPHLSSHRLPLSLTLSLTPLSSQATLKEAAIVDQGKKDPTTENILEVIKSPWVMACAGLILLIFIVMIRYDILRLGVQVEPLWGKAKPRCE